MTVGEALTENWRDLRDDVRHAVTLRAIINFAYNIDALNLEQRELWLLRITTCPGHEDEGGRDWCAYCGNPPNMPSEAR